MKKGKGWLLLAIGVPVIIGGYFVYKYFFPMGKKKDVSLPPPGAAPKPALTGSPSVFPIKNGSPKNDLVKQLQALLGVTVDGLFGPKTQAALFAKTGKTSIASQTEFNTVIAQLSSAAKASTNASRADKLVSDWNSNRSLRPIA